MLINAFPQGGRPMPGKVEPCRYTTSGTFDPAQHPTLDGTYDVLIAGGGQGGGYKSNDDVALGGAGGRVRLIRGVSITSAVSVAIGKGGAGHATETTSLPDVGELGGTSSFAGYSAEGGGRSYTRDATDIAVNPYDGISYGGAGGSAVHSSSTSMATNGVGVRAGRGLAINSSGYENDENILAMLPGGEGSGGGGLYMYNVKMTNANPGGRTGGGGGCICWSYGSRAGDGGDGLVIVYGAPKTD